MAAGQRWPVDELYGVRQLAIGVHLADRRPAVAGTGQPERLPPRADEFHFLIAAALDRCQRLPGNPLLLRVRGDGTASADEQRLPDQSHHILPQRHDQFMPDRSRKRPRDLNALAASVVSDSTDQDMEPQDPYASKNPAAVELGRLGGLKGG